METGAPLPYFIVVALGWKEVFIVRYYVLYPSRDTWLLAVSGWNILILTVENRANPTVHKGANYHFLVSLGLLALSDVLVLHSS